jgi:DNA-binding response OmpR family regulator
MDIQALSGRWILLVEEEPEVALRLADSFRRSGATVYTAGNLREALHRVHHPALSAAVVNVRLGANNTSAVCRRLTHFGVPFMFHTRYDAEDATSLWPDAPVISKPADSREIMRAVAALLH